MIIRKSYQHKIGELGEKKSAADIQENFLQLYFHNPTYEVIKSGKLGLILNTTCWTAFPDDGGYLQKEVLLRPHQKEPKGTVVTLLQE